MSKEGEELIEAAKEMLQIAKGIQAAASVHINGHSYVPEDRLKDMEQTIAEQAKEIERCHARLEIDHHFIADPNDEAKLVRVDIPLSERDKEYDGIYCRDATIALLEERVKKLEAKLAKVKIPDKEPGSA